MASLSPMQRHRLEQQLQQFLSSTPGALPPGGLEPRYSLDAERLQQYLKDLPPLPSTSAERAYLGDALKQYQRTLAWNDRFQQLADLATLNPQATDFEQLIKGTKASWDTNLSANRTTPWTREDFQNFVVQMLGDPLGWIGTGSEEARWKNAGRLMGSIQDTVNRLEAEQAKLIAQYGPNDPRSVLPIRPMDFDTKGELIPQYDPTRVDKREALKEGLAKGAVGSIIGTGIGSALTAGGVAAPSGGTVAGTGTGAGTGAGTTGGVLGPTLGGTVNIPELLGVAIPNSITVTAPAAGTVGGALGGAAAGGAAGGIGEIIVKAPPDTGLPKLPDFVPIPPVIPNPPPPDLPPVDPGAGGDTKKPLGWLDDIIGGLLGGSTPEGSLPTIAMGGQATSPRLAGLPYDSSQLNPGAVLAAARALPNSAMQNIGLWLTGDMYNGTRT